MVSNIPVNIGVQQLKLVAYYTLLPLFVKWSKNAELALEDVRLHFKDWVELMPSGSGSQDVGAIASKFFIPKGKMKILQFQPNKVLDLYLELVYDKYAEILSIWLTWMIKQCVCSSMAFSFLLNLP